MNKDKRWARIEEIKKRAEALAATWDNGRDRPSSSRHLVTKDIPWLIEQLERELFDRDLAAAWDAGMFDGAKAPPT